MVEQKQKNAKRIKDNGQRDGRDNPLIDALKGIPCELFAASVLLISTFGALALGQKLRNGGFGGGHQNAASFNGNLLARK